MGKKKEKSKSNRFFYMVLIVIIALSFLMIITSFQSFPIDYTNGKVDNATIAENQARTMIAAQAVPTVVNGIIATTSIIIGFSATLTGLLAREVFSDDKPVKEILIVFLPFYLVAIAFLYMAYSALTSVGQFSLETALRYSLMGLLCSMFLLLFIFLFYTSFNNRVKKIEFERCQDY